LATEGLIQGEYPHPIFAAKDRKAIDIIVPVYKSVHLTTRHPNALVDQINEIASSDHARPSLRSVAQRTTNVFRGANFIVLARATLRSGTGWPMASSTQA
jgi:hypothetical protein